MAGWRYKTVLIEGSWENPTWVGFTPPNRWLEHGIEGAAPSIEVLLDAHGKAGWELVGVIPAGGDGGGKTHMFRAFFKAPA